MSGYNDEELARRLQDEEYRARQEELERQRLADEEFARQLSRQMELETSSSPRRSIGPTRIRLRHPHTENEIGEVMLIHNVDAVTVAFEMENQRGKYLCVKNEYTVEFTRPSDGSHHFQLERLGTSQRIRLLSKRFVNSTNAAGAVGWCLSLDGGSGRLIPNAPRTPAAEWLLINADNNSVYTYNPPPPAATTPVPPAPAQRTQLQPGQPLMIRLKNPLSGHMIQDPLRAIRINDIVIVFELARAEGVYLVVNNAGALEYMPIMDESAKFIIETTTNERILLSCMAHTTKRNANGTSGWYLALDAAGRAVGNAARSGAAEWIMIAAESTPIPGTVVAAPDMNGSSNPLMQQSRTTATSVSPVPPPTSALATSPTPAPATAASATSIFNSSIETQLKWLASNTGQMYLSRQPELMRMYHDGTLKNVLHRSDWPKSALKWVDYSESSTPYESVVASSWLTDSMRSEFFSAGVMKISNCIPAAVVREATKTVNHFMQLNTNKPDASGRVVLTGGVSHDFTLLQLLYESPIFMMLQRVLGEGQVAPVSECEVSVRYPQLGEPTSPQLGGKRWAVDGFTTAPAATSPYSLLLAIPLSEQSQPLEGNLCIFPSSHETIHEAIKSQLSAGTFGQEVKDEMNTTKTDLAEPQQMLLCPGDAVLMHAKMAHREAPNYGDKIRLMVYFRISHKQHAQQIKSCEQDLWAEFDIPPPDYFA